MFLHRSLVSGSTAARPSAIRHSCLTLTRTLSATAAALAAVAMFAGSASAMDQSHIIGGQPVAQGAWPYTALILLNGTSGEELCSGSVIAPNLIMTAGHCAYNPATSTTWPAADYTVITGAVDPATTAGQQSGVSQVILDSYYKPLTASLVSDWDVSLLELSTPTTAPTIALASETADAALYNGGTPASIAGWGLTIGGDDDSLPDNLQYAPTEVESEATCAQIEQQEGGPFDPADQMCATDPPADATGTCQGDSGGPMVATDASGNPVEIGVTSFGADNCPTSQPSFFTTVAAISPWVSAEMAALSQGGSVAPGPGATTKPAKDLTDSSATLTATITPSGGSTSYYFDWGTTIGYGSATPAQTTDIPSKATASISGVDPGVTIHYRVVAVSQTGTTYGADETLKTLSKVAAPAQPAASLLPLRGVYRGLTHERYLISAELASDRLSVNSLSFGLVMSCTRHRGKVHLELKPSGHKLWPKRLKNHVDFFTTFSDAKRWRYSVHAVFTTGGAVSGTLSVTGKNKSDGTCRSGTVRFTAKVGV